MQPQPSLRVGVIGGTGRTGRRVVARLLKAGHAVQVLARRETYDLPCAAAVLLGDALHFDDLERFSAGLDVVVCTLGPDQNSPADLCSRATELLVRAMRKHGVKRLIVQTGAMIGYERLGAFYRFLGNLDSIQYELTDRRKQERIVRASGLEWTLIRPPRLSRDTERGHAEVTSEMIKIFDHVSRGEVAEAITQAVTGSWVRQSIALVHRRGERRNPSARNSTPPSAPESP
jgi:uncharacterized protein YbjT (DUF2867 family)